MSCASVIPAAVCAALSGQPTIVADATDAPSHAYADSITEQPAALHKQRRHRRHYRHRRAPRVVVIRIREKAVCKPERPLTAVPVFLGTAAEESPAAIVRRGFEPFGKQP